MNELAIYQLFGNILAASVVMEGRFFMVSDANFELNTSNFSASVLDVLDGMKIAKKYPCVVMLPPYETQQANERSTATMRFDMYFLTLSGRTGDGDVKSKDLETNKSLHTREQDWKDMRECAGGFRAKLMELVRKPPLSQYIGIMPGGTDIYRRLMLKGNDSINGIHLTFELMIKPDMCIHDDYPEGTAITIPEEFNPHPLHKH
jgi:hypothetical protein